MPTDHAIPHRLHRAVTLLAPGPSDRLLEIGCGNGVLADLICSRLRSGKLTALDRSTVALHRARARNAAHLRAGAIEFLRADLAAAPLPARTYDVALAVNVNCFWSTNADVELTVIGAALKPGGNLWLFYEAPDASDPRLPQIAEIIKARLRQHRFDKLRSRISASRPRPLLVLSARCHAPVASPSA